jgi:hypothetical protein
MTAFVGQLRAAADESVLVSAVRRARAAATLRRAAPPNGATESFELAALEASLAESRLGRIAASAATHVRHAWSTATSRASVEAAVAAAGALTPAQQIRVAGLWVAVAASTVGAFTPLDPRPASAARWGIWIGVLVLGAAAAAWPEAVHAAWIDRRRLWRRTG